MCLLCLFCFFSQVSVPFSWNCPLEVVLSWGDFSVPSACTQVSSGSYCRQTGYVALTSLLPSQSHNEILDIVFSVCTVFPPWCKGCHWDNLIIQYFFISWYCLNEMLYYKNQKNRHLQNLAKPMNKVRWQPLTLK